MTMEQFRKAHQAQPFQPYTLHLASGRSIRVTSPEFVGMTPGGRTIMVATSEHAIEAIDLLLVETIEIGNGRRAGRSRR
jgi:hypothetical protein